MREEAEDDPLIAIAGGGGVSLFNSMGNAWTADYLKVTGELDVDLRSNIAAEARAKIVYERLINCCRDAGTKEAVQFLMTREITHMRAFMLALESMGKPPLSIGRIAPTPSWSMSSTTTRRGRANTARSMPGDRGMRVNLGIRKIARVAGLRAGRERESPGIHAESSGPWLRSRSRTFWSISSGIFSMPKSGCQRRCRRWLLLRVRRSFRAYSRLISRRPRSRPKGSTKG